MNRISATILLGALMCCLPVGCGIFRLSDQSEPVARVTQADELPPIIPAGTSPVGSLPAASSVSASGGYEQVIRLDVPKGRALEPRLTLHYSSGAGVEALGVGWSVGGATSLIKPCAPTFATNGHVDFPTQLCLDQQPLVAVGNAGEYRTENESYAQISAQPAGASWPESWVVRLKDGRIRTYEAVRYAGMSTRFWTLVSEEDRRGNTIKYSFDHQEHWEECTDVQKQVPGLYPHCASPYTHFTFRIAQIDYTSRGDEEPRRNVVFHYAPPDPSRMPTYVRVWDREKQSYDFLNVSGLLDTIEMYGPGEPWQGTPELAWSYDLDYQTSPDTGRPLLTRVTKCSASGGCLLAREFKYSERSPGADDSYEVIWERTFLSPVTSDQIRIFDANNDGKDDIYFWADVVVSQIYLSPDPTDVVWSFGGPGPDSTPVDLDGDGAAELVGSRSLSLKPLLRERWAYKALPSGELVPWVKLPDTPALYKDDPFVTGYHPVQMLDTFPSLFADLDGDQLPDVCRGRPGYTLPPDEFPNHDAIDEHWTCALNLGNGSFSPFGHTEHTTFFGDGPTYLADLDGDSRAEFHQGEELTGDPEGDGLQEVIAAGTLDDLTIGDFDGDGRTDKLFDATLEVSYARDSSAASDLSAHRPGASNGPVGNYRGDFNADGRDDLLLVWNDASGDAHFKAITMAGPDPDRLVEVRDEDADWRERITYARTFAPDGDPQGGSAPFPNTIVRRGFSVVSRLESRTGTPRDRHFAYYQPTYDRRGRGFLGFGRVLEWQPDRPALLVSMYDNNQANDGGVYPAAFHPGMTMEIVPVIEQPAPGSPIPHPSLVTARIKRAEYRYALEKHPSGTFSIIPDPGSSWNSDEWEQPIAIDWSAWPPMDWWSLTNQVPPSAARRREGVVGLDSFGNVVVSMEQTRSGQHPTLGAIGGTKTTTWISYDNRPQDWLIGLPDLVTVKSDAADGSSAIRKTKYQHDAWGMVESIEHEPGGSASDNQLIEFTRNDDGLVTDVTATDGGGVVRALHIAYDEERVHRTQTWNDYGHTSSVKIHPTLSVPMTATDLNGVKGEWVHDDLGRLRYALPQAGNASTTTYERWMENGFVRGTIVHTAREDGSEGEVWLDEHGRTVTLRSRDFSGQWRSASIERDVLGRVFFEERPHYAGAPAPGTGVRYDSLNRVVETTLPDSTSRESKHDLFGAVHYDAQKNEQHVTYDFDGRVVQTIRKALPLPWDPGSSLASSVVYGPFGQIKTATDPGGNPTTMFYDARGRRSKTIEPDRGTTTVHYNGHGEIAWVQTAAETLSYTRDALGRVTHITDAEGVATFTWDVSPNGVGKLASAQSVDGTLIGYTYDSVGRAQDVAWTLSGAGPPLVLSRGYDSLNRLKTLEYPDVAGLGRTTIQYAYNAYGYLEKVLDASPAVVPSVLWEVIERNQDDALREAHGGDWITKLDYDDQSGRLEEIEVIAAAAQTSLLHLTYERDGNGFVDRRTEHVEGRDEVFRMDGHHRLREWLLDYGKGGAGSGSQTSIYAYDSIDNLAKVSVSGSAVVKYEELFTHGSSGKPHALYNRAKAVDPQTFFYDARGRILDGDGRQYTYTSFDLPRTITTSEGVTQLTYDPFGARVRKQGPSGTTTSIPDLYESREGPAGLSHVFVVHGSDGPVAEIVYQPSQSEPRTVHYRHHDALGSVSLTTTQGGPVNRGYYEPFGARVDVDGSPGAAQVSDVHHGFTGHLHDDELGLISMRGRVFDPSTRQFLTPDPLGRLGASPYSYVSNNPLNWIDPSGFTEEAPGGAWFSDFDTLFGVVPSAAIDMSQTLVVQFAAVVAAMDFPNGNDAPNSSGCPNGTGTAPRPCAAPGQAGCTPHPREPPTVRQAPLETVVDRILMLDEPPDEIGPYSIAYHIKHGIVTPIRRWVANEPNVYLDAEHNVRTSSVQRDYSHEMAPVLGEVTLMVAPGANAFARVGALSQRGEGAGADVVYHYTSARAGAAIERTGLFSQSSVTNVGTYTAQEAVELLGVKMAPEVVVEISNAGKFIPNKPPIVQPHPLGPGGGVDLTNPLRVPADCILCIRPVRKP